MIYLVDKTTVCNLYSIDYNDKSDVAMDVIVISHCDFDVVQN